MEVASMMHAGSHNVIDADLSDARQLESDMDVVSTSTSRSDAASQISSVDESTSSQPHEEKVTRDPSKPLLQHKGTAGFTPPPSQARPSILAPQTGVLQGSTDVAPTEPSHCPRIEPNFPFTETRSGRANSTHSEFRQGQKRTANGHVKTTSTSTIMSPGRGHSRQSSSTSQVGELSAQLRARLSYAMVKVQNGWESRTFDEVETLASQQQSPMSARHSPRENPDFSGTKLSPIYDGNSGFARSSERTTLPSDQSLAASPLPNGRRHGHAYTPSSQPMYTYQTTSSHLTSNSLSNGSSHPTLAPPVDFSTQNPRRSRHNHHYSNAHLLNGARNPSNISSTSSSSVLSNAYPATPPQSQPPLLAATPSQKATAMEEDAIATLINMSSPGNSQISTHYHHQYHAPVSHLRNGNLAKSGYADEGIPVSPRKKGLLEKANLRSEESIDQVLDQMRDGDGSSSDEEGTEMRGVVGGRERAACV